MQSVRFNHRFASPVHIPTSSNAPYICACSSSVHLSGRSFSFVQTILLWRQTSHVPLPQIHDAHKVRPPSCMLRQTNTQFSAETVLSSRVCHKKHGGISSVTCFSTDRYSRSSSSESLRAKLKTNLRFYTFPK